MAGYSGTPLIKKLGIKNTFDVSFVNAPENYVHQLELPSSVNVKTISRSKQLDFIQAFVKSRVALTTAFAQFPPKMKSNGMLWISWPKKSSGVQTDLDENVVRDVGLASGLVDVKVCAVDEVWSGLKFVFRVKDRPKLLR
jgi:hypothetical protein